MTGTRSGREDDLQRSTVVDSDQIVVLDAGWVVATGTHADLLQASPLYAELARSQLLV